MEQALADDGDATQLLRIVGGLTVGTQESENITGVKRAAKEHGLEFEIIEPSEIRSRCRQFQPRDDMIGGFDPQSGVLFPEKCVAAHLGQAEKTRCGPALQRTGPTLASGRRRGPRIHRRRRVHRRPDRFLSRRLEPGFLSKLKLPFRLERKFSFGSNRRAVQNFSNLTFAPTTRGNTTRQRSVRFSPTLAAA